MSLLYGRRLSARRTSRGGGSMGLEALEPRMMLSTITVTSLADNLDADGQVTLREAIVAANSNTSVDGSTAGSGADEILFSSPLFTQGPGTITLGLGELQITDDLTITGPGADLLTINGNNASRVFFLQDDSS